MCVRACVQHLGHSNLDGWSDTKGLIMTWVIIQLSDFARHGYAQSCRKRSDYGPDEIYKHIVAQYPVHIYCVVMYRSWKREYVNLSTRSGVAVSCFCLVHRSITPLRPTVHHPSLSVRCSLFARFALLCLV